MSIARSRPAPHVHQMLAGICLLGILLLAAACAATRADRGSLYTPTSEADRDPSEARRLTQAATAVMESDPSEAEDLLRRALGADIFHGPAHNNLGVLLLQRGDLYAAANEFEWARKLLPGHPDPRLNLAITLERAGRYEDALAGYESALEVYPGHIPTTQGLVRLQLRRARPDARTESMLREIALAGTSDQWRQWAQLHLSKAIHRDH